MKPILPKALPLSVLYVEDDDSIRQTFAHQLERMVGGRVWTAANGAQGLEIFESYRPDLVITDVKMPVMDGLQMARRIKAMGYNTPVIVTTAHGESDLLLSAVQSGINEFLFKPFELEPIAQLLDKYAFALESDREFARMRSLLVVYKRVVDETFFFFRTDAALKLFYLNTYLLKRLDRHDLELAGQPLERLFGEVPTEALRVLKTQGAWRGRVRLSCSGGGFLMVELTAVALRDASGAVSEYAFMGQDVTELQEALEQKSQALEELNATLKKRVETETRKRMETEVLVSSIFESAQVGICVTDSRCRYVKVNRTYGRIFGCEQETLLGQSFWSVASGGDREVLKKLCRCLPEESEEAAREWRVHRQDGSPFYFYATVASLQTLDGETYKIFTLSDVTELKEAQNRQKDQESLLVQQSKLAAMGEMLGAIAHQWRQPLTAISGAALNLSLKSELGGLGEGELERTLGEIERLTQRMSGTINDFMDFFRPNKERRRFLVQEAVDEVLGLLSAQLGHRNIAVQTSVGEAAIVGCKNELEQVLLNLIGNARDAFENKRVPERTVRIYVSEYGWKCDIVVEDNAGGIEEKILERIGEPYFTTKGPGKGTGIGLYMSRMIVRNSFGGEIVARNTYDGAKRKGAMFIVSIPRQKEPS